MGAPSRTPHMTVRPVERRALLVERRGAVLTPAAHHERERDLSVVLTTGKRDDEPIKSWRWKAGSDDC